MKIIVFSDVHANLEAFEAFLEKADEVNYDRIFNLGDTVGYGADPNRCIELMREREIPSVTGNHDDVVLGRYEPTNFNPDARRAVLWARSRITEENKNYLRGLGDFLWVDSANGKALLVHGSPIDKDDYIMTESQANEVFDSMQMRTVSYAFIGHTHKACYWLKNLDGAVRHVECGQGDKSVRLRQGEAMICNVGSVGQPRDGNENGCFVVWDDVENRIDFVRFEYDYRTTQKKIIEAGLPPQHAERLGGGL